MSTLWLHQKNSLELSDDLIGDFITSVEQLQKSHKTCSFIEVINKRKKAKKGSKYKNSGTMRKESSTFSISCFPSFRKKNMWRYTSSSVTYHKYRHLYKSLKMKRFLIQIKNCFFIRFVTWLSIDLFDVSKQRSFVDYIISGYVYQFDKNS